MSLNVDYDKIFDDVNQINLKLQDFKTKKDFIGFSENEFISKMKEDYNFLHNSFNFIFNKVVSGNLDTNVFFYMVQKAKDVQQNKISSQDATKAVRQELNKKK